MSNRDDCNHAIVGIKGRDKWTSDSFTCTLCGATFSNSSIATHLWDRYVGFGAILKTTTRREDETNST